MSDLEGIKQALSTLSDGERWQIRDWLTPHTVDLDATVELRDLLRLATETLGDESTARQWLQEPNWALGDELPALIAHRSSLGLEQVRYVLSQIRSGGIA